MSAASANRRALRRLIFFLLALALWTLLAMYPNPAVFFRNLARYHHLPLDPQIEQKMGWDLPSAPATIEFVDDVSVGTYQVAAVSPLGPLDRQRVLAASGAAARLDLLASLLADEEAFIRAQLAMEAPPEASD